MTVVDKRVNGVLAAVLSASVIPIHGALARERTPSGQRAVARLPATVPVKAGPASAEEAAKPEDGEAADK